MNHQIRAAQPRKTPPGAPALKSITGADEIRQSYAAYLCDESRLGESRADEIVFAHSEEQVVALMRRAAESRNPVTVSGARTGIVGGAVPPGGILLSMEQMNRFLGVRWDEEGGRWCVRVQPGLSLEELKEILERRRFEEILPSLDEGQRGELERFSEESDAWFYPVDPTEKSAHLGGTVATNASGARSFKYGQTRDWVTALRVVLADGTLLCIPRGKYVASRRTGFQIRDDGETHDIPLADYRCPSVKNTAGYFVREPMDLIDVFIGSEGTLGVITEAELALARKPTFVMAGVAFFRTEGEAVGFVKGAREKREKNGSLVDPAALEYFDSHSLLLLREKRDRGGGRTSIPPFSEEAEAAVYFEQGGKEEDADALYSEYEALLDACGGSADRTWGSLNDREIQRMTEFRHALPETINTIIGQRQKDHPCLHKVSTDFVVPSPRLEEMIRYQHESLEGAGFEYAVFGHIGESHLHLNILPRDQEEWKRAKAVYLDLAARAVGLGGTVSGEHGIGKLKTSLLSLMYSKEALDGMKSMKEALDPFGLLGRGNLFP